jgi:hypothetical protein
VKMEGGHSKLLTKSISVRSKMLCRVTLTTKRDQVLLDVFARVAAILLMVYGQVAGCTAHLTIASQDASTQVAVWLTMEPDLTESVLWANTETVMVAR